MPASPPWNAGGTGCWSSPAALDDFVGAYPQADRRHLESLINDANLERTRGGPPHRYRELFRQLKAAVAIEK